MNSQYTLLKEIESNLLQDIQLEKKRNLYKEIDWNSNCILIYGERGVGKTYLLLQKRLEINQGFYFSADSHIIESNGLFNFVFWVIKNYNEKIFYIDEIHKYSNWIVELKNLLDSFPQVKFIISGSSAIGLYKGTIDLGRRIVDYKMHTLSFAEYLYFKNDIDMRQYNLEEITQNYNKITSQNISYITEIGFWEYLRQGYYPFGINEKFGLFGNRLNKLLDQIIFDDMIGVFNFRTLTANKLTKLFYFIANNKPSEISVFSLSKKIGVNKDSLGELLVVLDKIGVINMVSKYGDITDTIKKQQKIFLGNPNLYYINGANDIGTIREVCFVSQIKRAGLDLYWVKQGDYIIRYNDKEYRFEIGGKNKNFKQIKGLENSFLVIDDIYSDEGKIPLWLFGFLD